MEFTVLSKLLNALLDKGLGLPLTLIFGKKSKGGGADYMGVQRSIFDAASGTDVGANIFHRDLFSEIWCGVVVSG